MKEFWNERYASEQYIYGKEPNAFFKAKLDEYHPAGKILMAAEGEGRNAVFAARQGLTVTAFDLSEAAKQKAMKLAAEYMVDIEYHVGDLAALTFEENAFDALALIFAHFPPGTKRDHFQKLTRYLKPGGLIIFEAFSKRQIQFQANNPQAGGPKNEAMLFSKDELRSIFHDFEMLELEETTTDLNEGEFHKGTGSVVRMVARKS